MGLAVRSSAVWYGIQNARLRSRMLHHSPGSRKASVLLSGGIDSSACVSFYRDQGFSIEGVFIDYGQIALPREIRAAESIAEHYRIPLKKLKWSGGQQKKSGFIYGRNAFLLFSGLMELPQETGILAIGIHSGTTYSDCSMAFVRKMQALFDFYTHGMVQIGTPFLKWLKGDIWHYSKSKGLPLNLTYSCELGEDQPCGHCLSCRDLEILYAST